MLPEWLDTDKNLTYRSREYLTLDEVKSVIDAAGNRGRHKERDRCLLLLMFRHGLRAGEAAQLKWDAIMLDPRVIYINRLKGSQSGNHPLLHDEIELLIAVKAHYPSSYFVFANERGQDKEILQAILAILTIFSLIVLLFLGLIWGVIYP